MSSNSEKLEEVGRVFLGTGDIFKDALINAANDLTRELSESAQREYAESPTNQLAQSVKAAPIATSSNGFSVPIIWEEYGNYQDKGVSGAEIKRDTPYSYNIKMPPISAWARYAVDESHAFAISKSVFKKGFKGTRWASKVYEDPNLISNLAISIENYIAVKWQ